MTPRSEALAYRIWAYAKPREWNVTLAEIADALGESHKRVLAICRIKKWLDRVRVSPNAYSIDKTRVLPGHQRIGFNDVARDIIAHYEAMQ